MKLKFYFNLAMIFAVAFGSTLTSNAVDWWPFGQKNEKSTAPVQIDNTPVDREVRMPASLSPVVKKVSRSVVNVFTTKTLKMDGRNHPLLNDPFFRRLFGYDDEEMEQLPPRQQQGLGSGVIITRDGYILTANHVIEGADEIKVALADELTEFTAKVIGKDPQTDIALLKVDGQNLPAITLTDSDLIEVGDFVMAIGNPFGVGQTVTTGIVSATSRGGIGIAEYEDFIQTDAAINPGNSGGALVDIHGRLIGINTAIATTEGSRANAGIGFAVPVNLARSIMEQLLKQGRVVRGYLGVGIQNVTPDLAREFNISETSGVLVSQVTKGSAGEAAGLKAGDIIIRYDGKKVNNVRQLRLMVSQTPPGTKTSIVVIRDGKEITINNVTPKELPGKKATAGPLSAPSTSDSGDLLEGVEIDELNARTRQSFNIPDEVTGVVITDVDPASSAYAAQLRPGDVIQEINRQEVRNMDEALAASKGLENQKVLLRVWQKGMSRFVVIKPQEKK